MQAQVINFTIMATSPYTPIVITIAIILSTVTLVIKLAAATVPKLITTISAERIKSVRIAPLTLSFHRHANQCHPVRAWQLLLQDYVAFTL